MPTGCRELDPQRTLRIPLIEGHAAPPGARRPSADWRIRPRAAPIPPAAAAAACVATSSSSAAVPPARPSPRCSPSTAATSSSSRRRTTRAFTSASRCCRPTSPCSTASACASRSRRSACRSTASSSSRPSTSIASSSSSATPGTSRCRTPGRCGARELDELLFRNAAAEGRAHLRRRARARGRVRRRRRDRRRSSSTTARGAAGARASSSTPPGRDTLLANQLRCKEKNKRHNSSALYGHFTGAERLPGKLEGNITIFWFEHGWFWFIPLADGTTSIGAVCWPYYLKSRTKPLPEFFRDTIALCPELEKRLAGAKLVDDRVYATGNYSYASARSSGERYLMIGDAYAFVDPVFSSGVYLAMQSAFDGAARRRGGARRPAATRRRCGAPSTATCSAARASSRGSSSASPTRRCASSSWRRRTRSASRRR